jgi:hypothetical protein
MPTEAYALCPREHLMLLRKAIVNVGKLKTLLANSNNYQVLSLVNVVKPGFKKNHIACAILLGSFIHKNSAFNGENYLPFIE